MSNSTHLVVIPPNYRVIASLLSGDALDKIKLETLLAEWGQCLCSNDAWKCQDFASFIFRLLTARQLLDCCSNELLSKLKAISQSAAIKSINRDLAMKKVATAFRQNECEALLLKGVALDQYLYERESFRQGVDIDLLVEGKDFHRVEAILAGIAKKADSFSDRPAHGIDAGQMNFAVDVPIPVYFDIHQQYAQEGIFPIDVGALFERAQPHPVHGQPFMILAPEDNLIHFAIHGFKEQLFIHKQTVDSFLLIQKHEINWTVVVERARKAGALMPLIYLLEGMRLVFGFSAPEPFVNELRPKGIKRLVANRVMRQKPPPEVRTGWAYRGRQLTLSWVLSGNLRGYLKHQFRFLRNSMSDRVNRLINRFA